MPAITGMFLGRAQHCSSPGSNLSFYAGMNSGCMSKQDQSRLARLADEGERPGCIQAPSPSTAITAAVTAAKSCVTSGLIVIPTMRDLAAFYLRAVHRKAVTMSVVQSTVMLYRTRPAVRN